MSTTYPYSANQIAQALSILLQSPATVIKNGFQMLEANYQAYNREISTGQLAEAAGLPNYQTANMQYGAFAHLICDELGYTPELRANGTPMWITILCTDSPQKDSQGHFQLHLLPEVAEALELLGLSPTPGGQLP